MTQESPLRLLLVDDDADYCRVLSKAFARRGFEVSVAHDVAQAAMRAQECAHAFAVVDLNMPGESGLALIPKLKLLHCEMRIVVLTGYASIATAVEAIKLGASHYLAKPASIEDILAAFNHTAGNPEQPVCQQLPSVERMEWEHIQRVLLENNGNISETARQLRMHRRTLQRKLAKRPVRD
jgi:two-component system response regulator RegA